MVVAFQFFIAMIGGWMKSHTVTLLIMDEIKSKKILGELVEAGSEMIGGGVATGSCILIGSVLGGPAGAVIGGALGAGIAKIYSKVGVELKERIISKQQEKRMGAVFVTALEKIEKRLKEGKHLRNDDFFSSTKDARSAAEELLEGTLLVSQQEYEEMKIPFYGNLMATISFSNLDRAEANFLLRIAERLSFRQYCLLFIFNNNKLIPLYKPRVYNSASIISGDHLLGNLPKNILKASLETWKIDLDTEIKELVQSKLIKGPLLDLGGVRYDKIELTEFGNKFYGLLELGDMKNIEYCKSIAHHLIYEE